MSRSRAKIAFEANCRILERLGETYWSAAAMAEMGNLTLKELDRVYAQAVDGNSRKSQETSGDIQTKGKFSQTQTTSLLQFLGKHLVPAWANMAKNLFRFFGP